MATKKYMAGKEIRAMQNQPVLELPYLTYTYTLDPLGKKTLLREETMLGKQLIGCYQHTNASRHKEIRVGYLQTDDVCDIRMEWPTGLAVPYRAWTTVRGEFLLMQKENPLDKYSQWVRIRTLTYGDPLPEIQAHLPSWVQILAYRG